MKKFIALMMVLGLVGFAIAQDLDCPTSGVAVEEAAEAGNGASMFDTLMAKMLAQKAEIEANRVTRWAFDNRYGWIWQIGAEERHGGVGQLGFAGVTQGQLDEAEWVRDNLTPAEYAEFQNQAENVWMGLEAQGLN